MCGCLCLRVSYQEFGSFPSDTINVCLCGLGLRELHFSMASLTMSDLQLTVIASASLKNFILWPSSLDRTAGGRGNPQSQTPEWEQLLLSHLVAGITHQIIFFFLLQAHFHLALHARELKIQGKCI